MVKLEENRGQKKIRTFGINRGSLLLPPLLAVAKLAALYLTMSQEVEVEQEQEAAPI